MEEFNKFIYLDNAATTRPFDICKNILDEYVFNNYYNPSSSYMQALSLKNLIDKARESILRTLNANNHKIIFTSSGTESNNWALNSVSLPHNSQVIIGGAEHASIYNKAIQLQSLGYDVIFAPVQKSGEIDKEKFLKLVNDKTRFISIMHVNNETGAINNIEELSLLSKKINKNLVFHSDGVQAVGKINVDLSLINVDLYTISAHKLGGIRGAAALIAKNNINLKPFMLGGGQEYNLRSSTENTAAILCLQHSLELKLLNLNENILHLETIQKLCKEKISQNGNYKLISDNNSKYICAFALKNVKSEIIQHILEENNILIGIGSACNSTKHNLRIPKAIGLDKDFQNGVIRLSFDENITLEEIAYFFKVLDVEYSKINNKLIRKK